MVSARPSQPGHSHTHGARYGGVHGRAQYTSAHQLSNGRVTHLGRSLPVSHHASSAPRGGFEGPMTAPWRKTVSIFKQPVTLVHTTGKQTKATPSNNPALISKASSTKDKPKQVFWAKRLEGLRCMRPLTADDFEVAQQQPENSSETNGTVSESDNATSREVEGTPEQTALPSRIQPLGPDVDEVSAVASLNAALSNVSGAQCHPVMGQTNPKRNLDTNIAAFVNSDQPLMQAVVVSDQDILSQQKRVLDARRRLEELRKHFG